MLQHRTHKTLSHWVLLLLPISVAVLLDGFGKPALGHEPVFGLGPETIFEGGVGIETEFEFEDDGDEQLSAINYEIIYGLREYLSLTLKAPQILEREENDQTSAGLGDIEVRAKYRFYKKDLPGAQHKISGIFGVKAPTGNQRTDPPLGTGTTDFLLGGSYGYESRAWYRFISARYRLRTESGGRDPGNRLFIDGAVGYRPVQGEYLDWDFVVLLEANAEFEFRDKFKGTRLPDTGGDAIWLGPTGLLSYRNIMFKGGIQFPVYENLNGDREHSNFRAAFGIEYHF